MVELIISAVAAQVEHREPESLEFPGCRPVRITRDEIDDREDYLEVSLRWSRKNGQDVKVYTRP